MRQTSFRKFAIATSTFAIAAMFSFSWSEQSGVSLSVDNALAQTHAPFVPHKGPGGRLYVSRNPNPYTGDLSGLPWYAVRAYYAGGPWCGVAGGSYSTTVGLFGRQSYTCYSGWDNYKQVNGIGCDPGTPIKGGDGIVYVCQ